MSNKSIEQKYAKKNMEIESRLIRLTDTGMINLNDLNAYYPEKRLDVWMKTDGTKELIQAVDKKYGEERYHQTVVVNNTEELNYHQKEVVKKPSKNVIRTKEGRSG